MAENQNYKDLLAQLKAKGQRQPDYTRALIKEKLADQDQEIATTAGKVTQACPLGKMRMVTPARASTCNHLQCFDAQLYLAMNERKPKWVCPVCNKAALMENRLVDGFFTELIASSRLPADEHKIALHNDGTWDPLPPKVPDHLKPPTGKPAKNLAVELAKDLTAREFTKTLAKKLAKDPAKKKFTKEATKTLTEKRRSTKP